MDKHKLIEQCNDLLDDANGCLAADNNEEYHARMSELLGFLMIELIGDKQYKPQTKVRKDPP